MFGPIGDIVFGTVAFGAAVSTLFSFGATYYVTRRKKSVREYTPPVTIFKPLKGCDEGLEENLRSFFRLDYPTFQLLFGVADPNDSAIAVVEKLLSEFPEQDAHLVVGNPPFGLNPKVENMSAMWPFRHHDVILISDSNVLVEPSYLRETTCYLGEPGVGLVTNMFAGVGEKSFGAAIENLHLNGYIAGGHASATVIGITCVVGKSMLMPVHVLEAAGGLSGVRNLLAEDQALALRVVKAGYKVRLSHHVIKNINEHRGARWFLNRHSRWFKIRRRLAPTTYLLEPGANLFMVGLIWALVSQSYLGLYGLLGLMTLGMVRDAVLSKRLRGASYKLKYLLLSPVKDMFLVPVWFDALLNRRVQWRGNTFLIGKFTRLREARASRLVRRRARRAYARARLHQVEAIIPFRNPWKKEVS